MTGIWLPLVATALAAALTYLCCIRPMRRQDGCGPASAGQPERTEGSVDEEIRRTREELRLLRAQAAVKADPVAAPERGPETIRQ